MYPPEVQLENVASAYSHTTIGIIEFSNTSVTPQKFHSHPLTSNQTAHWKALVCRLSTVLPFIEHHINRIT